ncbi:3-mercaptopyruvate sulfurtransferase [Rosenbergiella australiborealis]|uniref:Sulfurtransferase n=1 Tax=Rosenbergiella australiborealis TaxID=1544696 RepID=A0ABS5T725_9GAMM|nr:3-mercaptopyruvate sulfurtransferase [Rosenbergiella australiborealis]MBT0728134.1 3-mercaptopyruvate sulfurtransferase [Rosenbergiella australiborealis]
MTTEIFVTPQWLMDHLNDTQIQVLDARLLPPGQELVRDVEAEYLAGHLPQAVFFNIEKLSDTKAPYPHMLPRAENFAVAMRELGVDHEKHLIVYDEGNLFSAPRAWWMLRHFGVENVSILAGGLRAWQQAEFPLASGETFLAPTQFESNIVHDDIIPLTKMLLLSHEGGTQIIDARATARFKGEVDEPRPGLRRGHIPNSLNLPWDQLVSQGCLKDNADLRAEFRRAGVDITQPAVVTCGSGVTAVVLLLALYQLGQQDVGLYDGSWGEWGSRDDLPVRP